MTLPKPYYDHAGITIYHGNCLEIMPDLEKVDLVLTDPPYGVGIEYGEYQDTFENWKNLTSSWLPVAIKKSEKGVLFTPGGFEQEMFLYQWLIPKWRICWYKGAQSQRSPVGFKHWENVFVYGDTKSQCPDYFRANASSTEKWNDHPVPKQSELFAWLDPNTVSWKTSQGSLIPDTSVESSVTYPRAGTMQGGKLYRRLKWERRISEIGSGFWPTMTARDSRTFKGNVPPPGHQGQDSLSQTLKKTESIPSEGQLNPAWVCWLMGWPIGSDSLEPMPDLMWLDWEIDPADMEKADSNVPTPTVGDTSAGESRLNGDYKRYRGEDIATYSLRKGQTTGPIPRVATGIKDRVNRLKALGNGQVPQCMATAWNILTGDWFQ